MCGGKGGGGTSPTFSQPSPITTQQNINQATQQQQQYQANPLIQQYISQALGQAGGAAARPFSAPLQQMAGFTPMQQQYFQQLQNIQGMTNPYFNQAQNFMGQGANLIGQGAGLAGQGIGVAGGQLGGVNQAQGNIGVGQGILAGGIPGVGAAGAPVTAGNIADYMNPFAADTLAAMKKYVFDPQRVQTMGQQTQMAGGVGADRLALASQNLDKTQADAIAAAQAGFWQPAMNMAEQQKQMALQSGLGMGVLGQGFGNLALGQGQLGLGAANVGLGMGNLGLGIGGLGSQKGALGTAYGNLGTAAQNAALQATGALGAAGTQQQRLDQAALDAQFRQAMQAQAYPFQTAQFLSGIAGGLAPAMGGTTTGAGFTSGAGFGTQMPSQPSIGAQAFGLGTGILGGLGSLGAFNNLGSGKGGFPGSNPYTFGVDTISNPDWGLKRGGRALQRGGIAGSPDSKDPIVLDLTQKDPGVWADARSMGTPVTGPINPMGSSPYIGGNVRPGLVPGGYRIYDYQANDPSIAGTFTDKQAWLDMGGTQGAWDKRLVPSAPSGGGGGPGMFGPTFWPNPDQLIFKNFGPTSPAIPKKAGMAKGGDVKDSDDSEDDGVTVSTHDLSKMDIPSVSLPMGSGAQTGARLDLSPHAQFPLPWTMQQQQQSGGGGGSSGKGSGIGTAIGIGLKFLPMMLAAARGGKVDPMDAGVGFQDGGFPLVDEFGSVAPDSTPAVSAPTDTGAGVGSDFTYETPSAGPEDAVPMPQARPSEANLVDPSASMSDVYKAGHDVLSQRYGSQAASGIMGNLGVESPNLNPKESHDQGTGIGIAGWRNERKAALFNFARNQGLDPTDRRTQFAFLQYEIENRPSYVDMIRRMQDARSPAEATKIFRMEYERPAGTTQGAPLGLDRATQLASNFHSGDFSGVGDTAEHATFTGYRGQGPMGADRYAPSAELPYPATATQQDWGQRAARSPWMSLISAGAAMAGSTKPLMSAMAQGIGAGAAELQSQRKELRSEAEINQKAQDLHERALEHQARLEQERYQWQPGTGRDPNTGAIVPGAYRLPTRSGDAPEFIPGANITGKGGTKETALERNINYLVQHKIASSEEDAFKILRHSLQDQATFQRLVQNEQKFLADRAENAGKHANVIRAMAEDNIRRAQSDANMRAPAAGSPTATPAGTQEDPLPMPPQGTKPAVGKWYRMPDGSIQIYRGG